MSRVIKLGSLTQDKLIKAILNAPVLRVGKFDWAITDVVDGQKNTPSFIFGKLAKYSSDAHITVVDPAKKSQVEATAPNLLMASAPFVYLPDVSGIAFLHIWNEIQEDLFPKRFCALIQRAYDEFFVECSVEPVADYRQFSEKLESLERITEMSATVHPPNPLFGEFWQPLKEYLRQRNAEELSIKEKKTDGEGIKTDLRRLLRDILSDEVRQAVAKNAHTPDVTDAAMLMASDGYGKGKIVGETKGEEVVIRTADTHKSFLFPKDPDPHELAQAAAKQFEMVTAERLMRH